MRKVVLLRGVMPTGKNRIPKMSYLGEILTEVGFEEVQTYIQSGNIILETSLSDDEIVKLVHRTILDKIGADLSIIIKTAEQLKQAISENPFMSGFDLSRVHLVFSNDLPKGSLLENVNQLDFGDEKFAIGEECFYMYLPRDAKKKRLNNNYLEKQLQMISTMRKLSVISRLYEIATEKEKL